LKALGEAPVIKLKVDRIGLDPQQSSAVVVLKDEAGRRLLPVSIGGFEAQSIAMVLQGIHSARPLTHDLLKAVLDALDVTVSKVLIDDLREQVFYAQITLNVDGRTVEIDSRPSDAVALAVRCKCPIFALEHVLSAAGVAEMDTGDPEEDPTVH
jgi:bifunctional DNase/RNase